MTLQMGDTYGSPAAWPTVMSSDNCGLFDFIRIEDSVGAALFGEAKVDAVR